MAKKIEFVDAAKKKFLVVETSESKSEYNIDDLEKQKTRLEQDLAKINEIITDYNNAKSA